MELSVCFGPPLQPSLDILFVYARIWDSMLTCWWHVAFFLEKTRQRLGEFVQRMKTALAALTGTTI